MDMNLGSAAALLSRFPSLQRSDQSDWTIHQRWWYKTEINLTHNHDAALRCYLVLVYCRLGIVRTLYCVFIKMIRACDWDTQA